MKLSEVMMEVRELRADVQGLKQELQRYRGFVGGVLWCIGALGAVVGFVWGLVWGGHG